MTWVLIIISVWGTITIPGYPSKNDCQEAAPIVLQESDLKNAFRLKWSCVPGPPK